MPEPISIRASSLGELFDCAMRWEAKHLQGVRRPSSGAAHLGTAIHAGTSLFDRATVNQTPVSASLAVERYIDVLHNPTEDVDWFDIPLKSAEPIGAFLTSAYCREIAPAYRYRMVEMQLAPMDIACQNGVVIRLTGTMDRARVIEARLGQDDRPAFGIADLKTGKRVVTREGGAVTKGHGAQLGTYELLFEHTLGVPCEAPAEIIGLQTTQQTRIGRSKVFGAKERLIGTPESPGLIEYAADTLKSGLFRPNPQSRLCSPQFCPNWDRCKFHE